MCNILNVHCLLVCELQSRNNRITGHACCRVLLQCYAGLHVCSATMWQGLLCLAVVMPDRSQCKSVPDRNQHGDQHGRAMKHCNHAVVWHRFHTGAPGSGQCELFGSSVLGWRLSDRSSWCCAACDACCDTGRAGTSSLTVCGVWWAGTGVDVLYTATHLQRSEDNNCDTEHMQHNTGLDKLCVLVLLCQFHSVVAGASTCRVHLCKHAHSACTRPLCATRCSTAQQCGPSWHKQRCTAESNVRPPRQAEAVGQREHAAVGLACVDGQGEVSHLNVMFAFSSTARASGCCNCEGAHKATCDVWCDEVVR